MSRNGIADSRRRSLTSSVFCAVSKALFVSCNWRSSLFRPCSLTRLGCGEIGRSGNCVSAAVSALSSLVKATLNPDLHHGISGELKRSELPPPYRTCGIEAQVGVQGSAEGKTRPG